MRLGVVDGLPVVHSKFITKYTLEASQKDDTVRIDATSKSATDGTFINGNGGGDTITIGTAGSGLNSITGTVTVNGGPGLDVLIVDDQNGTAAGKYLVTDTKIQRIGGPSIENTDAIERTLKGAAGGNIIDITGNTDKLTVYAGPGSDEIHAGEVGGLGTILGAVNIDGEGGFDILRVRADFLDPTLTAIERLEVQNGTFTVNTAALIFQQVEQTGGTLAGTANVTASESLVWLAGTMTGTGKMIADGSASISGGPVTLTRELDLAGNSFWTANVLGGTGKILNTGTLTTTSPQLEGELTNSGMLLPGGEWGVGYVNVTGNVSQTALGSLRIDITSTGYDQMIVNGPSNQVSLAGGLNVTLAPGYSPAVGTVFTIIQNNTSGLVLGNFFGLTNGSILVVGSTRFRINYGMPADSNNVTLTVVNEPPVANADFATTDEDTSVDIAVLANDTDPDNDALTIASVGVPFNGTATIVGSVIRYTPNANFNGTDTFTYVVADAYGNTASALVTITVNPINDAPIAVDDAATVTMLGGTVFVLANDSDVDGDELTIIAVGTASHGVASISGSTIFYVPNAGYSGTDTFTYTISDGHGLTATANVTVTV